MDAQNSICLGMERFWIRLARSAAAINSGLSLRGFAILPPPAYVSFCYNSRTLKQYCQAKSLVANSPGESFVIGRYLPPLMFLDYTCHSDMRKRHDDHPQAEYGHFQPGVCRG